MVARDAGAVIAAAGVERYDAAVLVRSVVVAANARGRGLGARLVDERLRTAARGGVTDAYLLTTTAEAFFGRLAFATITRDAVPAAVRASRSSRRSVRPPPRSCTAPSPAPPDATTSRGASR